MRTKKIRAYARARAWAWNVHNRQNMNNFFFLYIFTYFFFCIWNEATPTEILIIKFANEFLCWLMTQFAFKFNKYTQRCVSMCSTWLSKSHVSYHRNANDLIRHKMSTKRRNNILIIQWDERCTKQRCARQKDNNTQPFYCV